MERKTAAACATTAVGGSGPSAADIAAAVRVAVAAELTAVIQIQTKVDAAL